jgi:hypothetical protein
MKVDKKKPENFSPARKLRRQTNPSTFSAGFDVFFSIKISTKTNKDKHKKTMLNCTQTKKTKTE